MTRRRLLVKSGAAASAAWLAACRDSKDSKDDPGTGSAGQTGASATQASGAAPPAKAPRPGGVLKSLLPWDIGPLDSYASTSATTDAFGSFIYNRLLAFKWGVGKPPGGEVEGELAASYEQPADGSQVTFKLRPNAKWDGRAPTNGRALDSSDVKFSWEKFAAKSVFRRDLANSADKNAPIESVSTPDAQTVVFKTAFPSAVLLPLFASLRHFWVQPREAESGLDLQKDPRGTGPFVLDEYAVGVRITFNKNPNYFGAPERSYVDRVELPIIKETSTAEAQFKAKNVWHNAVALRDIADFKKTLPDTRVVKVTPDARNEALQFGWNPGSPFTDERVRQAISMLIDRAAVIDVFNEVDSLKKAGIDVGKPRWGTIMSPFYEPFWLDPEGKEFGEHAKYYQRNVAEAKKLLAAAGHPNGLEVPATFITSAEFGADWARKAEIVIQMLAEGGVRAKPNPVDYNTVYLPIYVNSNGKFDGLNFIPNGARADVGVFVNNFVGSIGTQGGTKGNPMPELDALIEKQFRQLDRAERIKTFHEMQRLGAKLQPIVPFSGAVDPVDLVWNWLEGFDDHIGWGGNPYGNLKDIHSYLWIDRSKQG